MSIGVGIRQMLLGKSALTDLVGDNIQPLVKDQKLATPCIIYTIGAPEVNNHFSGASVSDTYPVTFHVFDKDYDRCVNIMRMLRSSIDYSNGRFGGWDFKMVRFESSQDEFDMQAELYGQTLTFSMRVKNDPNFGFTLVNFNHVTSGVGKVPLSEVTFEGLFEHITAATGVAPRVQEQYGVLFTAATSGAARAPRGDVSYPVNFTHATVGVSRSPRGEISFTNSFVHEVVGVGREPRKLVEFLVAQTHDTSGIAQAPRFITAFAQTYAHNTTGVAKAPRSVIDFSGGFTHETLGVGASPGQPVVPPVGFDTDYQAILDYATSKGWALPSAAQQIAGNNMVVALKTSGIWSKLYFLYPAETNGDVDFACINWKDPQDSTNMTRVNSPIYAANQGFKGDGVSAYLDIPYNPTALGWDENDFSYGAMDLDNISAGSSFIFSENIRLDNFIAPRNPVNQKIVRSASTDNTVVASAVTNSTGLHLVDRNNSSNFNFSLDGVSLGNFSQPSSSFVSTGFYLLLGASVYSTRRTSMAFAGQSIWANQADFFTAINNYRGAL